MKNEVQLFVSGVGGQPKFDISANMYMVAKEKVHAPQPNLEHRTQIDARDITPSLALRRLFSEKTPGSTLTLTRRSDPDRIETQGNMASRPGTNKKRPGFLRGTVFKIGLFLSFF